jgi:acetyl/propionyl-CoA carboxylase alpha subunit
VIADKAGQVRVRASMQGAIDEVCVRVGEQLHAGQRLVVVEGDSALETMRAKNKSVVMEVHVKDDDEVAEHALLIVLRETQ